MSAVVVLLVALQASSFHRAEEGILISAGYPSAVAVERLKQDLATLRRAGFNAVTTSIDWKDGEPRQGAYNLLPLDRVVAVASAEGLRVFVDVRLEAEPEWKKDGTNALAGQFFDYVRRRFVAHPTVVRVAPASSSADGANRALVGSGAGALTPRETRRAMWSAIARGARTFEVIDGDGPLSQALLALGDTAGVITRNLGLFAPLRPAGSGEGEVAITAGEKIVVHLLESPEAIVIVAINHVTAVQKGAILFPPRIPEAIWQNMEAGVAVHFVMTPRGPMLEHTFAPDDVLVLAIRKRLR